MASICIRGAGVAANTTSVLAKLLIERGVLVAREQAGADGIVCYGWGIDAPAKNILNANAGKLDNYAQLVKLSEHRILVPPFTQDIENADFNFPLLARNAKHHGGKDIRPVFQEEELPWRKAAGAAYFTQYIPSSAEYRIWVYRRRILLVLEKAMQKPELYKGIGRNYKNGFVFEYRERKTFKPELLDLAARAVFALELDFGGVDLLIDKHNNPYILEVNSAPGTTRETSLGINKLADCIKRWVNGGFREQSKQYRGLYNGDAD